MIWFEFLDFIILFSVVNKTLNDLDSHCPPVEFCNTHRTSTHHRLRLNHIITVHGLGVYHLISFLEVCNYKGFYSWLMPRLFGPIIKKFFVLQRGISDSYRSRVWDCYWWNLVFHHLVWTIFQKLVMLEIFPLLEHLRWSAHSENIENFLFCISMV